MVEKQECEVCLADRRAEGEHVIRTLYRITTNYAAGFDAQMQQLLQLGRERFDLDIAILAHVTDGVYTVKNVVVPDDIGLAPGATFDLAGTYCCITLEADGPVGFEHVGNSEIRTHPAYKAFCLESYVGVPVVVNGETYGTLNFSSPEPRTRSFTPVDLDALRLMATWVGNEIQRRRSEAEIRDAISKLDHTERAALVGEVVAAYQHELNNPLSVALAALDHLDPEGEEAGVATDAVQALIRMRDVLREMGRMANAPRERPEVVEIAGLLMQMLADARWRHRFRTELQTVHVRASEPRLYQALHNVLLAHIHGDSSDTIRVACGEEAGVAVVRIESGCVRPRAALRTDLLSSLRGRAPLTEVPLALAEHIATELDGSLEVVQTNAGLVATLRVPVDA